MNSIIHADIFFFVTTIVVVAVGLVFASVLIYVLRILNDVKKVTKNVRNGTEMISQDLADLRNNLKSDGGHIFGSIQAVLKLFGFGGKKTRARKVK